MIRCAFLVLALTATLSAKPEVIWETPADVVGDYPTWAPRATWINEDEVIAVRRGGLIGRYHCGEKAIVWEKRMEEMIEAAVAPGAVYVILEIRGRDRVIREIDLKDGTTRREWSEEELEAMAKEEDISLPNRAIWLPKPGLLAVEYLGDKTLRFFDPQAESFKGKVSLGDYFWHSAVHEDRVSWLAKGVIFSARCGDREAERVWDSGIRINADDAPQVTAYGIDGDGGFAVVDKGGWVRGVRFFLREGKDGKVNEWETDRDLGTTTIDMTHKRVWAMVKDTGWLGALDFSGKVVAGAEGLLEEYAWEIAVSPSSKKVAVVGNKGTLSFVRFP